MQHGPCTFRPFDFYPNWKLKKLIWYFQYLCFLKSKNEFVFLKFNFLSLERWKSKLLNAILVIHLFKGKKLHVLISIVVVNCIEFISTILRFVKSKNWNRYSISVERKIENWQKKLHRGGDYDKGSVTYGGPQGSRQNQHVTRLAFSLYQFQTYLPFKDETMLDSKTHLALRTNIEIEKQ